MTNRSRCSKNSFKYMTNSFNSLRLYKILNLSNKMIDNKWLYIISFFHIRINIFPKVYNQFILKYNKNIKWLMKNKTQIEYLGKSPLFKRTESPLCQLGNLNSHSCNNNFSLWILLNSINNKFNYRHITLVWKQPQPLLNMLLVIF